MNQPLIRRLFLPPEKNQSDKRMKKHNDWRERLGVTYSTNPDFAYQTNKEEEPPTLPAHQQQLRVQLDKRNRGGKVVTLITGFQGTADDLAALGKVLRVRCGVGGATKDGEIILQGDLRQRVTDILAGEGYGVRVC